MSERFRPYPPDPRYQAGEFGTILGAFGRPLAQLPMGRRGDMAVSVGKGNRTKVSRMVCWAWHGAPFEGAEADHIDEDPTNNSERNLQWLTRQANMAKSQGKIGAAIRASLPVVRLRDPQGNLTLVYHQARFCAANGLCRHALSALKAGRYQHHRGWTYVDTCI